MKKVLKLLASLVILLLIAFGAWYFLAKNNSSIPNPVDKFKSFFPVSNTSDEDFVFTPPVNTNEGASEDTSEETQKRPRLFVLHKTPVVGGVAPITKEDGTLAARYIEKGLGHIYETDITTLVETRISNQTRKGIQEAIWGNKGDSVIAQYTSDPSESTVRTNVVTLGKDAEVSIFLPENIVSISAGPYSSNQLFYVFKDADGVAGITSTFQGQNEAHIFSSSLSEWNSQWASANIIALATKPSGYLPGALYFLTPTTRTDIEMLSDIIGLTTLVNTSGDRVLYSESSKNTVKLNVYDTKQRASTPIKTATLPEKCAWSTRETSIVYCAVPTNMPNATYPDKWYQGIISFDDQIWKIDTGTGVVELLLSLDDIRANQSSFDITNISLDEEENFLFFENKKDSSVWGLELYPELNADTVDTQKENPSATSTEEVIPQ